MRMVNSAVLQISHHLLLRAFFRDMHLVDW